MRTDKKTREQKKLRKEMIEYLEEYRSRDGFSDSWTPGKTGNYNVAKMAKAKIGSASYETKGAKKWRKAKQHLENKARRRETIENE